MSDSNLTIDKFGKICRTCLSEADGQMKPLYDDCSATGPCLVDMLVSCAFVQFHENDGLPVQVCFDCVEQITRAYNFAKLCERTSRELRACFNNFCIEMERRERQLNRLIKNEPGRTNDEQEIEIVMDIDNNHEDDNSITIVKYEIEDEVVSNKCNKKCEEEEIIEENNGNCKLLNSDELIQEANGKDNEIEGVKVLSENVSKLKTRPPYKCKNCSETFPIIQLLKLHRIERNHPHPHKRYARKICNICSKSFGSSHIKQHMRTHTRERPYRCDECDTRFNSAGNLQRHKLSRHMNEKPYKCDVCGNGFTRLASLRDHQRTHTGERPFVCNLCGKTFIQSSALRMHHAKCGVTNTTNDSVEHQCPTCSQCFASRLSLRAHQLIHGEKRFLCNDCGRRFVSMILLKQHSKVHAGLKPYMCDVCGKSFSQIGSLKTHRSIHTSETSGSMEYQCPTCSRCFANRLSLRSHQHIHGEKRFLCSDCGRDFVTMIQLKSHSKVHTGLKPHTCNECGKSFRHIASLKNHSYIHTGEKPYVCPVCKRAFKQWGHLKYHMRTHSGERPYVCSVCGKTFALNGNLTVHMRTHTGETPYVCSVCGKGFHDSSSMKKHRKGHGASTNGT